MNKVLNNKLANRNLVRYNEQISPEEEILRSSVICTDVSSKLVPFGYRLPITYQGRVRFIPGSNFTMLEIIWSGEKVRTRTFKENPRKFKTLPPKEKKVKKEVPPVKLTNIKYTGRRRWGVLGEELELSEGWSVFIYNRQTKTVITLVHQSKTNKHGRKHVKISREVPKSQRVVDNIMKSLVNDWEGELPIPFVDISHFRVISD